MFTSILFIAISGFAAAGDTSASDLAERHAMNFVVVGPTGPDSTADFGPNTPNTKTSGIQEAFDYAKANRKDVYIAGGTMPAAFKDGVVYHIQETIRIPWLQDFRLDGGEYVINYDKNTGDAIVVDSQMSCRLKFGLIVAPTDGAVVHLKPETKGPDGFSVIVASTFEFNALVGGGSVFEDGKRAPTGVGLYADASSGAIVHNKFYATEVIACDTGVLMNCGPSGNPGTAISDNTLEAPFLHLCKTHLQVGDALAAVSRNRFEVNLNGNSVPDASGVRIFGKQNLFTLDISQTAVNRGIVFEESAEDNRVTIANLDCGITNNAKRPTNKVESLVSPGFGVTTPEIPASGETVINRTSFSCRVMVIDAGEVRQWSVQDVWGERQSFPGPLTVGQTFHLEPGEGVSFDHTRNPGWRWLSR